MCYSADFSQLGHNGEDKKLLIGKKNSVGNSYPVTGQFTIDQLELLQGNREFLRNIGHIQRGKLQSIIETPKVSLLCEI